MKKIIVSIVLVSISVATVSAQNFHIGAKAGLNLTSLSGDFESDKAKTSFHIGGMVEIPILDKLSVQPELLYSSQGGISKFDSDDIIKLNYITFPIMAKYYVWESLSVEAGPQVGFLLTAEREDDGQLEDLKDITKSVDIGVNLGLGYKLPMGLNFGLRYYFGGNINSDNYSSTKVKNSVFQISAGYFFN
jgi:hypothetical protein